MDTTQVLFDNGQLNRLFPYYILLNKDLSVNSCGTALNNFISVSAQSHFTDLFKIVNNNGTANFDVKAHVGFKMWLKLVHNPGICLEGNLEYLKQTDNYLFTGNLSLTPCKETDTALVSQTEQPTDKPAHNFSFYERVLNEVPVDIVVFDTKHTYRFLNSSAIKDPELRKWMIGKTDEEYCSYKSRPQSIAVNRHKNFTEALQTKQIVTWEEKMDTPDGSVSYLLRNFYPVLDAQKNAEFIIGYGIDITDRKRIEEELKINEKRYRDLYNFSPALIYTHDTEGTILSVNPAINIILGYNSTDVINRNIKLFLHVPDQDRMQSEYLNKVNQTGTNKGIFRINHKNGIAKYLFYQNYKVDETGVDPYIIGFAQDITERIKAEKELLLAKHHTENMARVKDTFLANMSHEIRTPMNSILGVTNLLAKTTLDEKQSKYASLISDSVNNLLIIINDILDMEKIRSGKIEFENQAFKVVDKIKSVIQSFQYKAERKGLKLILNNNLPANLVIIGDQHRLTQILTNLLGNAIKFTQEGTITVTLNFIYYSDTNVIIEYVVADTGIGISESRIGVIFDPFVKITSNFNSKFGGTGLGLSICKNLVEMQGGHIELNSQENKGTTFTFNLSYKRGLPQMISEPKWADLDLAKIKKKILVAEDIELNQFLVKTMLESWGCEVDIAVNGMDAVKKVEETYYDLILMDIQMPEMDGLKATGQIRALPQQDKANLPIIAFTANALQGDRKLYKDAGMTDYIIKPYTEEKLYQKITGVLKAHAQNSDGANNLTNDTDQMTSKPEENTVTEQPKLYNISILESISKNNPGFIEKMLAMFVDVVGADFENIKNAANDNNSEEVAQIAHKMKSTFGNMGVAFLLPYIAELEERKSNQQEIVKKLGEGIMQVFAQLKNDYPHLFNQ